MSLHSLLVRYTDREGARDALSSSDALSALVLDALPRTSVLSPDDHEDARNVACVVAVLRHLLDAQPIGDAVAYGWMNARDESIRDANRAAIPADDDADTFATLAESLPDRTTLPRAATYDPAAPYVWTVSDTVTVALSLLDDDARVMLDALATVPGESWWGGMPERDALLAACVLAGIRANRRTIRADAARALSALREACAVVTAWSANVRARDYWTDDARAVADAVADAVAVALDARGAREATGTSTSGPASPVVIRYRDTLADAWSAVVLAVETTDTDDTTGEDVATVAPVTYLRALSADDARDALTRTHAVAPYVRTRATLDADAWMDRLGWTGGAVKKSRSRKGSRVGSTGPTVPIGSRSGSGGVPLGLALGTFTVHPVRPIPHPVTERTAESAARISARTAHAARVAERDAALLATAEHAARVESATERARLAARALAATDSRAPHPAPVTYGPSRAEWETHRARA